jgi:hypothetical protein
MNHGEIAVALPVSLSNHINVAQNILDQPAKCRSLDLTSRRQVDGVIRPSAPGTSGTEFNMTVVDYFRREGLGIGGREGLRDGYCLSSRLGWRLCVRSGSDTNTDRVFEPGTTVNYENQFFMPGIEGILHDRIVPL